MLPAGHMHAGQPLAPHDLAAAWTLEPTVLAALALGAAVYALGARRVWRAAEPGRGIRYWQAASFAGGLLVLAAALVSPLDALAGALFSAHMTQHLLLILVAPPLLVAGNPGVAALWALSRGTRRRVLAWWRAAGAGRGWEALTRPATAWALHACALVAWHLPGPFDAALRNEAIHALEHASFAGTALLFWWPILHPAGRRRLGHGGALLYLFGMFLLGGGLGALLTFAPKPIYAYGPGTAAWGLTPLQDQQLAGLIMWIPAGSLYVLAAGAVVLQWFRADERRATHLPDGSPFAPDLLAGEATSPEA